MPLRCPAWCCPGWRLWDGGAPGAWLRLCGQDWVSNKGVVRGFLYVGRSGSCWAGSQPGKEFPRRVLILSLWKREQTFGVWALFFNSSEIRSSRGKRGFGTPSFWGKKQHFLIRYQGLVFPSWEEPPEPPGLIMVPREEVSA